MQTAPIFGEQLAAGFAEGVGHPVRMESVPRNTWERPFRSQGMKHALPRIRMIDGFNEGWIDFEGGSAEQSGSQRASWRNTNVGYGSLADAKARIRDVCFTPKSGHAQRRDHVR